MDHPAFYPEPNNIILSAGCFKVSGGMIPDSSRAGIAIRELEHKDIEFAANYFKRDYNAQRLFHDAFFLHISNEGIVVAASCPGGFHYAMDALGKMATRDAEGNIAGIKTGVLFDYACIKTRAMDLSSAVCYDAGLMKRFIGVLAELKYNTLIADWDSIGISACSDREELDRLCGQRCISVSKQPGECEGAIQGLNGPSFLDWEHKSRLPGTSGASLAFSGDMNEEELIRSGFLFNLVYSATMLWNDEYNNFSWERTVELAMRHAPVAARMLTGQNQVEPHGEMDVYPAALCFEGDRYRQRPEIAAAPGQTAVVADIGEPVAGLIFRHALEASGAAGKGMRDAGPAGGYTVVYEDGSTAAVKLTENGNIALDSVWCGRRYNAKTHLFDSDPRLHSLCCRTRPVKKVLSDGRLALVYEYEWDNPDPGKAVARVELAVHENSHVTVVVYGCEIINKRKKGGIPA